jgi:superfamily I DNA and/or RNA helicase
MKNYILTTCPNFGVHHTPNGCEISIQTNDKLFPTIEKGIFWENTVGNVPHQINVNNQEIIKCQELALRLSNQYPDLSIGVCSPFKDQSESLKTHITGLPNVTATTIQQFQGDEKDIIILSLVVNPNYRPGLVWYLNRESFLLNVAITRAKSALFVIGNFNFCNNNRDIFGNLSMIGKLARYIGQNGVVR